MNLTKEDLLQIENHIKSNIASWLSDFSSGKPQYLNEIELIERIVRVEEELKRQRELMLMGFEQANKRFEDMQKYMDKRFEDVNSRFTMMFTFMSLGFTVLAIMMTVFKFLI